MGGSVTVIIRENENTIHKMCRWTNGLPWFLKHSKFLNKDPNHLKEYLQIWEDMKLDYDQNFTTKNFKEAMTSIYIPDSGVIAPVEYGLVFIDYLKNEILSCQGFSSVDTIPLVILTNAVSNQDKEAVETIQSLVDENKLEISSYDSSIKIPQEVHNLLKSKNLSKDILALKRDKKLSDSSGFNFKVNMSPFTIIKYSDDAKGIKELYDEMSKRFNLSEKEHSMWQQFLKDSE